MFKSFHKILDAKDNNDLETAKKEQIKINKEAKKYLSGGSLLSFKMNMNKMFENIGINLGLPRAPIYMNVKCKL